ncbi:protease modulator HflC [Phenylobacterium sp.]|uniref:protease modulator HflC n=1 Tax=Phenylobacterium sp. TaxID=1871053 RepID=UPI0025FF00FB|nr:protease modulator HflC [Phenylobacterium sp.]MBX3483808.1 protease modulator HflC [Phenylobacterium sp.]MCW5760678.1 protease modulator HflC [Phenylobacterium sp.]
MSTRSLMILLGVGVFLVLLWQTLFIVDQREQAIVVAYGNPVRVVHAPRQGGAGLNVKVPFIQQVIKLDRRNIALESDQEEIVTAGQDRLVVDAFIRYRIAEPLAFYKTLRDERTANDRIERLVNSSLRQVLGSATTTDIISGRRAQLMQIAKADVAHRAKLSEMGIEVVDLRIRRVDLPTQNRDRIFRRMVTSRQQVAAQLRAEGEQAKREIIAQADKEVAITLATAREQSGQITGEGDSQRTRIFAQSFGKDPSFAAFFRSMQAYEASLANGDTTLVLSPDSAFFRYFERGPTGGAAARR